MCLSDVTLFSLSDFIITWFILIKIYVCRKKKPPQNEQVLINEANIHTSFFLSYFLLLVLSLSLFLQISRWIVIIILTALSTVAYILYTNKQGISLYGHFSHWSFRVNIFLTKNLIRYLNRDKLFEIIFSCHKSMFFFCVLLLLMLIWYI